MKRFFWKLFKSRNYKENKVLTEVIYRCIDLINNCPECKVIVERYEIIVSTENTFVELWNANKFYAWLSSGNVNGKVFNGEMPSFDAMFDFKECLKSKGCNIYFHPEQALQTSFDLTKIRC